MTAAEPSAADSARCGRSLWRVRFRVVPQPLAHLAWRAVVDAVECGWPCVQSARCPARSANIQPGDANDVAVSSGNRVASLDYFRVEK